MITVLDPPSLTLIPSEIAPVVENAVELYKRFFSDRLISVYVIGSVAQGQYRIGASDIDIVGIVSTKFHDDQLHIQNIKQCLYEKYGLENLDLDIYELQKLNNKRWLQFFLLTGGVCVWGSNYEPTSPLPENKEELAYLLATFLLERYDRIYQILSGITFDRDETTIHSLKMICSNHAKRAIRLSNTIVILRTGMYTNNTDTMTKLVYEHVPEVKEIVCRIDNYRLNPPANYNALIDLLEQSEKIRDFVLCHELMKLGTLRKNWYIIKRRLLGPPRILHYWYLKYNVRVRAVKVWQRIARQC